ncbi:MAG: hypothetical protein KC589_07580 [Nanoarchaeota archaeon]|nr:hypothetical protein [Nanoarchaeota archaeon]
MNYFINHDEEILFNVIVFLSNNINNLQGYNLDVLLVLLNIEHYYQIHRRFLKIPQYIDIQWIFGYDYNGDHITKRQEKILNQFLTRRLKNETIY